MKPSQDLAIRIMKKSSPELGKKSKLNLLTYISTHEELINQDNSYYLYLLELYVNNLILPPKEVTAIFLSTHFNLLANPNLSSVLNNIIVLDVSPIELETEWWNPEYTYQIRDVIEGLKRINYKIQLRICDAFNDNGEISWFDLFSEQKDMSVKWNLTDYTVRDLETTIRMCGMGKRNFSNYVTAKPKIMTK
jgi:hypothetical protein